MAGNQIFSRFADLVRLTGMDIDRLASQCPDPGREAWTVNPGDESHGGSAFGEAAGG